MTPPTRSLWLARFGCFELDVRAGELSKEGDRIRLQEQPFQVLNMLLERPGQVVLRKEIRKKLWPNDTIVEFDHSINAAVLKLRLALGDSAEQPKYLETVARRGYRLMVTVEWVEAKPVDLHTKAPVQAGAQPEALARRSLIGKKVSHYRVLEILGGGGMGVVYQAEDLKLGRRVALKFLPEELVSDPLALGRFEREARAASALEHRNICTIHQFGEHEGQPFIVMQLLHGQTLRERIEECAPGDMPFQTDELLDLAIQIAEGLEAAHQIGIIHRDIKPANIFITNRGEAKILDFGLAKLVEAGGQPDAVPDARTLEAPARSSLALTRTGATMGTASYMSPEQVRGEKLDTRTDLFSFGLVLYEMATGKQAFPAETAALVHEAILHGTPAPARNWNSKLPLKLEEIINKVLEKDRELRYQTASEIHVDLATVRSRLVPVRRPRWVPLRWAVAVVGLVALLLIAVAIFWFTKRQPPGLRELKQRQLTSNSSENPVEDGAISPDGKYLAYTDLQGIHIKLVETGNTQTVPQPATLKGRKVDWSIPSTWLPDDTRFLANASVPGQHPSIWTVSATGGAPREFRDDGVACPFLADAPSIPFITIRGRAGYREMWLMDSNGSQPRKLYEADENSGFGCARWSPDGQRLAYVRGHQSADKLEETFESRDLKGGPPTTIQSPFYTKTGVTVVHQLPDGRTIYSLQEPDPNGASCNFWEMRTDARTGEPFGKPRRLTDWAGFCMDDISVTADSKRLAFKKWSHQSTVYVADLEANRMRLTTPRRLTLNEGWNRPTAWTGDSQAVVFESKRNGDLGIFKQSLDEDRAEPIIASIAGLPPRTEKEDRVIPGMSSDGAWVLYSIFPREAGSSTLVEVMRVPTTGGSPQLVLGGRVDGQRCGKSPATLCALAERSPDRKQLIFAAFDPLKGRGRELTRFDIDPTGDCVWDLSPDGTRIALLEMFQRHERHEVKRSEGPIHILSLSDRTDKEIMVKGWNSFQSVNWAADGKALFVTSPTQSGSALLCIDLRGDAHVLWEQKGVLQAAGLPSPDGRHLAIYAFSVNSNFWMIENF